MNVLVDTSVWVDHFRNGNNALVELIERDLALIHPMVLGEIACGTPPAPRIQTLSSLALLRSCTQATANEVMAFIEREALYGMGCGFVEISLLASILITPGAKIWTLDTRLAKVADRFGANYLPPLH